MALSRRMIQVVAFAVLGVLLVTVGAYEYQVSVTNARNVNNNCPNNESCPTAVPNPMFLFIEYLGAALLVVAVLLGIRAAWSSRVAPLTPA
jgi:hypothetical protein